MVKLTGLPFEKLDNCENSPRESGGMHWHFRTTLATTHCTSGKVSLGGCQGGCSQLPDNRIYSNTCTCVEKSVSYTTGGLE